MYPEQPIYLKDAAGGQRVVPLAALTPADADTAIEAKVMDDEAWGLTRLDRRPLDRKGFAFKLELGALDSQSSRYAFSGTGFSPQFGYFPHHTLGILAKSTLEWGTDAANNSITRQSLAGELQFLPLSVWRLHFGGFGHVGNQWASDSQGKHTGLAVGGGAMIELALTTRLALNFRYDYTRAKVGNAGQEWAPVSMIGGGIAIY
jgi:opacity protein-like surface antigen